MYSLEDPLYAKYDCKEVLGGKGYGLRVLKHKLKLPVPPAFTIPIMYCESYLRAKAKDKAAWVVGEIPLLQTRLGELERLTARKFGSPKRPLLVSVRSGAAESMPGMMDTVLNLGLNDVTVLALAKETNEEFAWDSYRRFLQMYGSIVAGADKEKFTTILKAAEAFSGGKLTLRINQLLVEKYKALLGSHFPQDVNVQLTKAIEAVFVSWNSDRAVAYREKEKIEGKGTAVNIQAMVFGNLNDKSGTGVVFSRNPSTGAKEYYGDFLINAQGEDVVSGESHTLPFDDIRNAFPAVYKQLLGALARMELHFTDMVDVEFTIENGKLWILQVRVGKRSHRAAIKIAIEMANEGLLTLDEAANRIILAAPIGITKADENNRSRLIATGLAASGGKVSGKVALTSERAKVYAEAGNDVILVRNSTDPSDTVGMIQSVGILTRYGGLVSHAAVVARGWGKPCVVGAAIEIYGNYFISNDVKVKEGEIITIDGDTGEVFV